MGHAKPRRRRQGNSAGQVCNATTGEHADAMKLVEYLLDAGGAVEAPQEEIARKLNMLKQRTRGLYETDTGRFHRARQHLMERIDSEAQPCCGFRVHYRKSGRYSVFTLVDPTGDLGDHAKSAIASIEGYVSRRRQHFTEDRRMMETFRAVADHAMSQGDLDGARLMLTASIDIDRLGSISAETMGDVEMWLAK